MEVSFKNSQSQSWAPIFASSATCYLLRTFVPRINLQRLRILQVSYEFSLDLQPHDTIDSRFSINNNSK